MTPTGGERDTQAPKIKKSTPIDSTLNFSGGKFVLEFDEFVKVEEASKNITITPMISKLPTFDYSKNKVTFNLPDSVLEKNTTYKITYGNAIKDIHEGNVINNLTTTFSTGTYFDSMFIRGKVLKANTGLPDTSAWVALYKSTKPDSIVSKEKPLYITRSNGGSFAFENLPKQAYKILAFTDVNNNMLYDAKGEWIGFANTTIEASRTKTENILYTFIEENNIDSTNKLARRMFSQPQENNKLTYTVNIDSTKKTLRTFNYTDTICITLSKKMKSLIDTKIRLYIDSVLDANTTLIKDTSLKKIYLIANMEQDAKYKLELQKGFVIDSLNQASTAADYYFKTKRESDFGSIQLNVKNTEANKHYIIQLLQQEKIIKSTAVKNVTISFPHLEPGSYTLRIIIDDNNNNTWDTGSFAKKIQPERVLNYKDMLQVKANWDNTITWTLAEKK